MTTAGPDGSAAGPLAARTLSWGDPGLAGASDLRVARRWVEGALLAPEAEDARTTVLAFLDMHPDALHRTCVDGHLTGSAVVVDAARGRALLLLHRKLGRWFQPGGHADGDANLAAVALREACEETGIDGLVLCTPAIDVDVHPVDPPGEPSHLHLDLRFLVLAPEGADAPGNHESLALRWVAPDDMPALGCDPGTVRLVERGLALARR